MNIYNVSLASHFWCDGKTADVQLEVSSVDKYTMQGSLGHSFPYLYDQGLPPDNSLHISVTNGSILNGLLLLHNGNCKLEAQGEIRPRNQTEWALEMETDCTVLQVIPGSFLVLKQNRNWLDYFSDNQSEL